MSFNVLNETKAKYIIWVAIIFWDLHWVDAGPAPIQLTSYPCFTTVVLPTSSQTRNLYTTGRRRPSCVPPPQLRQVGEVEGDSPPKTTKHARAAEIVGAMFHF